MARHTIGVIGATSFVGECLLSLLAKNDTDVIAFSRQERGCGDLNVGDAQQIEWRQFSKQASKNVELESEQNIEVWFSLAPIWVLADHLPMLKAYGAKRVVALSSTSRFTKAVSSNVAEQALAEHLVSAEEAFITWAEKEQIAWTILQPTLIYGLGKDRNICELVRFIHRFGFYPLCGQSRGLRQPIHVEDVAKACYLALNSDNAINRTYIISGGEVLTYREMVGRLFKVMGKRPLFIRVPLFLFRPVISILRCFPRFKGWSVAMVERMNKDMAFDHLEATRDLGFTPRKFQLTKQDLPI